MKIRHYRRVPQIRINLRHSFLLKPGVHLIITIAVIVQKQSISAIAEPSPCPFNPSNHLKNLKGFIFCLSTASSESTFTLFGMWKRTFQVIPHLEFIQWWHIFHTLSRQSLCILTFYDTTGKKWKAPLYVKMMRKWRNFNWEKRRILFLYVEF